MATSKPYADAMEQLVFAPLGMNASYWTEADVPRGRLATAYAPGPGGLRKVPHWRLGAAEAAGGIYTSLRDLARYAAAGELLSGTAGIDALLLETPGGARSGNDLRELIVAALTSPGFLRRK